MDKEMKLMVDDAINTVNKIDETMKKFLLDKEPVKIGPDTYTNAYT
jgi:hypothetical protein